ncbi:MAG: DUF4124 domain-containing protein [Gammaproteobacteria bacterium SHHR-1]
MRSLLIALLLLPQLLCAAEVYRWTDAQGRVHFGDEYPDGQAEVKPPEKIKLKQPSVYTAPPPATQSGTAQKAREAPIAYRLEILSPRPEQSIHSAAGIVQVETRLSPAPEPGLEFQYLLDGQVRARGPQPSTRLSGVHRGAHDLQVIVRDAEGRRRAVSRLLSFYLHQPRVKKAP